MRRTSVLLALVVAAATVARASIGPASLGAPDPQRPRPALGLAAPFGDDLKGSSDAFLSLQARNHAATPPRPVATP